MAVGMVVFDLGQVLVDWDPALTQDGVAATPEACRGEWAGFVRRTDFWTFNKRLDEGLPLAEAREWFARHHGEDVAFLDRYVSCYARSVKGAVPGMPVLVEDLRAGGVRVGGLSNWPAELYHHATDRVALVSELEDVVVSGRVGVRKPDPAIYHLMLDSFGTDPSATVFVDDVEENVDAARSVGIDGVLFTGAAALRGELRRRGAL